MEGAWANREVPPADTTLVVQVIGRVGPWHPEGWPGIELGWIIRRSRWGHGFATEAVAPSPKLQLQPTTVPSGSVLVLVKLQVSPVQVWVKAAVGDVLAGATVMLRDVDPVPPPLSVTVRLTV